MRKLRRKKAAFTRRSKNYLSLIEQLEERLTLSHTSEGLVYDPDVFEASGEASSSPNPFPDAPYTTLANGMPILNSYPSAPAAVFIDFDGDTSGSFATVQPYDTDGNPAVFGATEQASIYSQWKSMAIYFAMFNVNVTTIQPNVAVTPTAWISIGDNPTTSSGGVSNVNVFPNSTSRSVSAEGGGSTTFAHEIGHNFGSAHISEYDNLGNKTEEYHGAFNALWAPIMGNGGAVVRKWAYWHSASSVSTLQDDMAMIASDLDNFGGDGYKPDDFGSTIATATPLTTLGNAQAVVGIIERLTDVDALRFTSTGGTYSISVGRDHPSSVDTKISVYDASGTLLAAEDGDPRKLPYTMVHNSQVALNLPAGDFYVLVESHGNHGDQGQYVLRVDPLATGWNASDIGLAGVPGYSNFDSATQTHTLGGSGSDIASTADSFQFAYQTLQGDGTITARVTSVENTNTDAKAGVMIRESLGQGSKNAFMLVKPLGTTQFQRRSTTDSSTSASNGITGHPWVRLTRVGNTITAFTSSNGTSWTQVGSQSITMGAKVLIGLASTSHSNTVLSKAPFTNVTVTGNLNPQPTSNGMAAPTGLVVSSTTSDSATLTWAGASIVVLGDTNGDFVVDSTDLANVKANFGGTGLGDTNGDGLIDLVDYNNVKSNLGASQSGYSLERSTDNISFSEIATLNPGVTTFTDTGLSDFERYFYRLRITTPSGFSAPSNAVMATTKAGAISDLNIIQVSTTQLVLDWTDASGEANYRVQRSTDGNTWTTVATLAKNTPMLSNTGLSAGTQYMYRVQSLDAGNNVTATSAVKTGATLMSGTLANLQFTNIASNSISLSWSAFAGATGYKVERSLNGDIEAFTVLAANQTGLTYTDNNVGQLGEYYYRVTPLNSFTQGASGLILTGSAPTTALASPWVKTNIGSTGGLGNAGLIGSTYTVIGGGSGVSSSSESVYFVSQPLTGDGQIVARVATLENIDISPGSTGGNNSKAGIMIRDSMTSRSQELFLTMTPTDGVHWMRRTSDNGSITDSELNGSTNFTATWLRITRAGNIFTAEISSNGTTWTAFSSTATVAMDATVQVGFAVLAGTTTLLNTSTFTNFSVTASSSAAPASSGFAGGLPSGSSGGGTTVSPSGLGVKSPTASPTKPVVNSLSAVATQFGAASTTTAPSKTTAAANLSSLAQLSTAKTKPLAPQQRASIDWLLSTIQRSQATWRGTDVAVDELLDAIAQQRLSLRV